jgi:hypothetical protein
MLGKARKQGISQQRRQPHTAHACHQGADKNRNQGHGGDYRLRLKPKDFGFSPEIQLSCRTNLITLEKSSSLLAWPC